MKKLIIGFVLGLVFVACGSDESFSEKDRITDLLKAKIGNELPFDEVKICDIEN